MSAVHATIHIGFKQLGIDEDDRRELYQRVTGKTSLRDMTNKEHQAVVDELKAKGFKPTLNNSRKKLQGRFAPKLQALWIAAWNLNLVKNKDDKAMLAFIKRQTGIEHTRFLQSAHDADKVIEALKGWMAREAYVDWSFDKKLHPNWLKHDGAKIALAQWMVLQRENKLNEGEYFLNYATKIIGKNIKLSTNQDWIIIMNALGRKIRSK